jgi:hypothetical protein
MLVALSILEINLISTDDSEPITSSPVFYKMYYLPILTYETENWMWAAEYLSSRDDISTKTNKE